MRNNLLKTPIRLSRRNTIAAGGGAVVVAAMGAGMAMRTRTVNIEFLNGINLGAARALGEGYYEVEGWILTADDIRRLGGTPPDGDR